ncbi:MAG TPA: hypothetical protein VGE21_15655, partial [Flavobacteriales bacterium]
MNRIPDKMMYRSRFRTCLSILWAGLLPLLLNAQENRRSAWFDDEAGFTDVENFMRRNAPALGITEAAADYRVKKEEQDAEGARHINIQRTQEGMDVVGGDGWIHVRANGTAWYGGGYVPSLGRLPQAGERRSAGACIAIALDHVSKGRPALDEGTGGTAVSLVVTRRDEHAPWGPGNTTLAYEVDLAELHLEQSSLLVDALDGRVLEERRHPKCVHTGTTNTLYDGPREFCTSLWDGNYFLKDDVWRYNTIRTFDVAAPEAFEIFSPNGVFNENAFEIAAASLHWAGQQTVKYFYYAHDLHIHDYLGGYLQLKMNSRTTAPQFQGDYSPDYAGAFSPRTAEFGMGGILTSGPYVAPD